MSHSAKTMRRFAVRPRADHHPRLVSEPSFEAAAVAFVEAWGPEPDADGDVVLIVRDQENGHERCFRIDLATGETDACD